MELVNTIFYYAETLKEYTDALAENKVLSRTIVFVDETQEIYKDGKVFGSYKKAAELVSKLAQEVRDAMDHSQQELTDLMNQLRDGVWDSFLSELDTITTNLTDYEERLRKLREEFDQSQIDSGDAFRHLDSLAGYIEDFATWKSATNGTLTTLRSIMDAQQGVIIRQGELLDTVNNKVVNFNELIDLQEQKFQQYLENYDITNKVRNIIGREILLQDGLLHDYATLTDVSNQFRNSIDVWFNSLEPSWTQLTSKAQAGQDAYTAMAGFRSEVNNTTTLLGERLNSVEASTTVFANWHQNNKDFVSALRNAAGDNMAYFDLVARLQDDDTAHSAAARIFGYVNSSGDSSLKLSADHIELDASGITINANQVDALGDWIMENVTVNKLRAGLGTKYIDIKPETGITNSENGFGFNLDGSGYVSKGELSWDTAGNLYFGNTSPYAGYISASNGSGNFAFNKFRWDTSGNISLGGTNPAGIQLNTNGSGSIANGKIAWTADGVINITGTPGKTIVIGGNGGGTVVLDGYWSKTELSQQQINTILTFDPSQYQGSGGEGLNQGQIDALKASILDWIVTDNGTGTQMTLANWITAQAQAYAGSGSGSGGDGPDQLTVQGWISNYLDNQLLPANLSNETSKFSGFQTKEALVTELNARLYNPSTGELIGETRLAQALSQLKKLAGAYIGTNGEPKGFYTMAQIDSMINSGQGGGIDVGSSVATWAEQVWDEDGQYWNFETGWSLSAFIKTLAKDYDNNLDVSANIIGEINGNGDSSITISANKINIAGVITAINNDNSLSINAARINLTNLNSALQSQGVTINSDNLNITAQSLGITAESLGVTANQLRFNNVTFQTNRSTNMYPGINIDSALRINDGSLEIIMDLDTTNIHLPSQLKMRLLPGSGMIGYHTIGGNETEEFIFTNGEIQTTYLQGDNNELEIASNNIYIGNSTTNYIEVATSGTTIHGTATVSGNLTVTGGINFGDTNITNLMNSIESMENKLDHISIKKRSGSYTGLSIDGALSVAGALSAYGINAQDGAFQSINVNGGINCQNIYVNPTTTTDVFLQGWSGYIQVDTDGNGTLRHLVFVKGICVGTTGSGSTGYNNAYSCYTAGNTYGLSTNNITS